MSGPKSYPDTPVHSDGVHSVAELRESPRLQLVEIGPIPDHKPPVSVLLPGFSFYGPAFDERPVFRGRGNELIVAGHVVRADKPPYNPDDAINASLQPMQFTGLQYS